MCKPIDEPQQYRSAPPIRKKRVRFGSGNTVEIEKVVAPDERNSVWYNRQDFQDIRFEIGQVVQAHSLRDCRLRDDDFYCFRGLEFLKLDSKSPSRKELRLCFAKNVLLFQCMSSLNSDKSSSGADNDHGRALALGAYCSKLSQDAKLRAQCLASSDEAEARHVYHECRLLYQVNGKEMRMFGPTCSLQAARSSIAKQQKQKQDLVAVSSLPELLSEYTLSRVIRSVLNTSTALFAASVK